MRLTASRVYSRPPPVPKMPPGLVELMEGLTKDVLKNNPPEVYAFCAEHMRKLLEIRDGPTTKKTLSLEQKISKAQQMVRKRAEQRWEKFNDDHQLQNTKFDNDHQISEKSNSVVDENILQTVIKPVHHNDLTQDSEIEISCQPNDTEPLHCEGEAKENLVTNVEDENNIKDIKQSAVKEGNTELLSNDLNNQLGCEITNISQLKKDDCDVQCTVLDCAAKESEITENFQSSGESFKNDDGDSKLSTDPIIAGSAKDVNDETKTNKNDQETASQSEDPKIAILHDKNTAVEDKDSGIQPSSTIKLPDSEKNVSKSLTKTTRNFESECDVRGQENVSESEDPNVAFAIDSNTAVEENCERIEIISTINLLDAERNYSNSQLETNRNLKNEGGLVSIVETIKNDSANNQTSIADLSTKNYIEVNENQEKHHTHTTKEKEPNVEAAEDVLNELNTKKSISDIDSTNDTEESNIDLEKVMNEAIENTKRKDSSADDSLKDNIVCNDESDVSEAANLVLNKDSQNEYAKENGANVLVKNEDHSEGKGNHDNDTIIENTLSIKQSRTKRSLGDGNIAQTNINQDDAKITTEILNDSSSTTLTDDSKNKAKSNETTKNDNSNTMDLETAAVTIQKVFRTFLFKSRASTFDESVNEENNLSDDDDKKEDVFLPANNLNKERRTLGISRMDTVLQTVNEEKSLSLSTDDSSLSSAATIIQAHVRGFLLRNKLHSLKSASKNSLGISNGPSSTSLDGEADQNKSKTILNIHIVPEGGNYLSRDESMITSMDLSLDGSPPSSVNLHPLGYNTSERRKQLKREDAVQSVSPPSNNSGKLSEDVDSIKELPINKQDSNANQEQKTTGVSMLKDDSQQDTEVGSLETTPTTSLTLETVVGDQKTSNTEIMSSPEPITDTSDKTKKSLTKQSSDEMDVITPFKENPSTDGTKLLHSGEFHDTALPTKVSRSDTPVVSEFKNVLVYFLLWNNS